MKDNPFIGEHGESNTWTYIGIIVMLLAFGFIWSVGENGWWGAIYKFIFE